MHSSGETKPGTILEIRLHRRDGAEQRDTGNSGDCKLAVEVVANWQKPFATARIELISKTRLNYQPNNIEADPPSYTYHTIRKFSPLLAVWCWYLTQLHLSPTDVRK